MAYTVKQVATMSKISVRTLHFYDESGLLKPAYYNDIGYRFYEEPQLLSLQQILFYRELGFDLKQIKRILDRADFERVDSLRIGRFCKEKIEQTNTSRSVINDSACAPGNPSSSRARCPTRGPGLARNRGN